MRFAIMESIVTAGGHEIDFDRILVEELTSLGHSVEFYVPESHEFKWNYGVPVHNLEGEGVSYKGARGLKKLLLGARRELNRRRWYQQMADLAKKDLFDAIIFPSVSYRYIRSLKYSQLLKSTVPVLFLIHGLTPKEAHRLITVSRPYKDFSNIRIGIQSFARDKLNIPLPHTKIYAPPNYIPRDINPKAYKNTTKELRLGFFGQFRREKNLKSLIDAFQAANFKRPVRLIIQGSTQTAADARAFEAIISEYKSDIRLEFWHRPLIGKAWQEALASVDALMMPYGNDRYLYHTSALISNAMGYKLPIIVASNVNPEVLAEYNIGLSFPNDNTKALTKVLEAFVNTYDEQKSTYTNELERAYKAFSPTELAKNIVALASY